MKKATLTDWINKGTDPCPRCGFDVAYNWFDRSICPEPCGFMHTRCDNCGKALDPCPWEDAA